MSFQKRHLNTTYWLKNIHYQNLENLKLTNVYAVNKDNIKFITLHRWNKINKEGIELMKRWYALSKRNWITKVVFETVIKLN